MGKCPPLFIPRKDWAKGIGENELRAELANYAAIERWANQMECGGSAPASCTVGRFMHAPYYAAGYTYGDGSFPFFVPDNAWCPLPITDAPDFEVFGQTYSTGQINCGGFELELYEEADPLDSWYGIKFLEAGDYTILAGVIFNAEDDTGLQVAGHRGLKITRYGSGTPTMIAKDIRPAINLDTGNAKGGGGTLHESTNLYVEQFWHFDVDDYITLEVFQNSGVPLPIADQMYVWPGVGWQGGGIEGGCLAWVSLVKECDCGRTVFQPQGS